MKNEFFTLPSNRHGIQPPPNYYHCPGGPQLAFPQSFKSIHTNHLPGIRTDPETNQGDSASRRNGL